MKKAQITVMGGLFMIALIVMFLCTMFIFRLNKTMFNETERYLSEISEDVATTINDRNDTIFTILKSEGDTYFYLEENQNVRSSFLEQKARLHHFLWFGIADVEGNLVSSGGETENIANHDFFQASLKGKNMIVSSTELIGQQNKGILYSEPLMRGGEVMGVGIIWNTQNRTRNLLSIENFNGEGFSQIVDQQGNYVVSSNNHNAPEEATNFFEIIEKRGTLDHGSTLRQMQLDLENGRSGLMYYKLDDGISKAMHYCPLEAGNLYLMSVVPIQVAGAQFQQILREAVAVNALIAVLFLLLILWIFKVSKKNQAALETLAFVDPVTGGCSRARFELEAEKAVRLASGGTYSLMSLDLQKFKLINDIYGSEAGDRVLRYIYSIVEQQLEKGEFVSRISADHFNILLKSRDKGEVLHFLDQVSGGVNQFNQHENQKYYLILTVGVYLITDPNQPLVTIQDRANVARKSDSKSCVSPLYSCVFYSDMDRLRLLREKEIENRMEDALKNGEFVVYLQPKVDLGSNQIAGAEALVRWLDPDKGIIPPDEFIPFFEKNGFIVKLDHYVFEKTCGMLRKWIDSGKVPLPVSVNLSRVHLNDPDFLDHYKEICKKYEIPVNLLEIELTESLVFENQERLLQVISQIQSEGFLCSLDDFGSGYSSLNLLKDVRVNVLKLDRAFFSSPEADDERENHVIESIVDLAKKLDMKTVSEGVETVRQMDYLRQIKCDMIQGYVFSKPVPVSQFEKLAFGEVIIENKHGKDVKET